jgi:hypothetical protein
MPLEEAILFMVALSSKNLNLSPNQHATILR